MDTCTFRAGGPEETHSTVEFQKYGRNRIAEGKLPICAEMCATKALLAGEEDPPDPACHAPPEACPQRRRSAAACRVSWAGVWP